MASKLEVELLLKAAVEGLQQVQQLVKDVEGFEGGAGKAAVEADKLDKELTQLGEGGVSKTKNLISDLTNTLTGLVTLGALKSFVDTSVQEATRFQGALLSMEGVARQTGTAVKDQFAAAEKVAADGLINITDSTKALQNLLLRGYNVEQAVATLERLKDAAAFNRQANLSLSEAVLTATEGLKNENSVLVDNAGVTKNVSVLWKEYADQLGVGVQSLTQAQKVQAEFNGIQRETAAQAGNAEKALSGLQGQQARLTQQTKELEIQVGQVLTPTLAGLTEIGAGAVENFAKPLLFLFQSIGVKAGLLVENLRVTYDAVTNLDFEGIGDKLDKNFERAEDQMADLAKQLSEGLKPAITSTTQAVEAQAKAHQDTAHQAEQAAARQEAAAERQKASIEAVGEALRRLKVDIAEANGGISESNQQLIRDFQEVATSIQSQSGTIREAFINAYIATDNENTRLALLQQLRQALEEGQIAQKDYTAAIDLGGKSLEQVVSNLERYNRALSDLDLSHQANVEHAREFRSYLDSLPPASQKAEDAFVSLTEQFSSGGAVLRAEVQAQQARLAEYSDAAVGAFDRIRLAGSQKIPVETVTDYVERVRTISAAIESQAQQQQRGVTALYESLVKLDNASQSQINSVRSAIDAFDLLDARQLTGLRDEVQRLQYELNGVTKSAEDAASAIQDRLDRALGNESAISDRQYAEELANLQRLRQAARDSGAQETIRQLDTAIKQLKELHEIEIANIEDAAAKREQAAAEYDTAEIERIKRRAAGGGIGGGAAGAGGADVGPALDRISQLADAIGNAAKRPLVVQLDGREIARAVDPELDRLRALRR